LLQSPGGMVYLHKKSQTHLWKLVALTGFGVAAFVLADTRSSAQTDEPRVIDITARRFAFEPAEIEARVGEHLRLVVRSADGVHGLEIKKLKIKKEVPRGGEPVTIDFTATTEGTFPILCSEYCGQGHTDMKGMLIVRSVSSAQP
jgi:cytochrome c oxidase subunit II